MTSQVSGRTIADLLDGVRRLGPDIDPLVAGLSIDVRALRQGHPRYDWDEFVVLMERMEHALGGPQGLERLGAGFEHITVAPVLRRITGFAATPLNLYRAAQRWALPRVLPQLESRIEPIDRGRLRIVCRIPDHEKPCPQLLHLATGAIRGCPTLLGLPPAEVSAEIESRRGQWIVVQPHSPSLATRVRTAARAAFSSRAAFEQLEKQQRELQQGLEDLQRAYARLEESEERYRALAENLEVEVADRTRELRRKNRDLRELQTLLLDAERLGTARDLAGRVAHSINNPLAALTSEVWGLLEEAGGEDPRLQELLELAYRVGDVVNRTLELYREGKIDRRSEQAHEILDDVRQSIAGPAKAKEIDLSIDAPGDLPTLLVDRPLVVTALESLAANAIEWLPRGGRLAIDASAHPASGCIRFRVTDNGPGIPEDQRERIFEPYFTTRKTGTGLGLPIANGVIRGHEGELRLEEAPGGGSRFIVDLPVAPRP